MAKQRIGKPLRFEDRVYISQWLLFRQPRLSDMKADANGDLYIDCGIGCIYLRDIV